MIRFEIKKIFSKTANKIGLIVLLAAIAVTCYFAISSMDYVDEEGDTHTGIAAARYLRDTKVEWEGLITEDVLREVIRQNRLSTKPILTARQILKPATLAIPKNRDFLILGI